MKKNLIKAFLSLGVLALVAASGMTIAQETYEVTIGNMNGYGRLNLGRLIMRNSGGSEGIILDGAYSQSDYVIKIGPNLATGNNLSKLRVTNICDNKGNNCKKVSDLSTGIKINGTGGLVCIKINDKEINCNQALGAGEITIMQGGISKGSFNVNTNSAKTIELSGAIALEGTNSRFCTKKDDNTILCNVATGAILNVSVPNPVPELSRGSTTTIGSVGGTVFKVTTPANPHKAGRNVVANTENGTVAGATDNTNTYLNYAEGSDAKSHIQIQGAGGTTVSAENNVITITSSTNGGGGDHITGQNIVGQYSNSTTNNSSVSFNPYINHVENSQVTSSILIKGSGATTVERSDNVITISSTAGDLPNATTTTLGGVKLGSDTKQTTSANNVTSTASRTYAIQVDDNGRLVVNVPRTGTAGLGDSLWGGNSLRLYPEDTNMSVAIGPRKNGMGSDTSTGNMRLAVNGNTVIMDGDTSVAKLGQDGVAFMGANKFYMGKVTTSPRQPKTVQRIYGVSIAGPIAIGYDENNTGNYIYIYTEGNTGSGDRHYEIMGSYELAIGTLSGGFLYFNKPSPANYEKYSIGVNTNTPQATFDINGGVKVGNECMTCRSETYGTIIYYSNDFWGCKPDGGSSKWVSLTTGSPMSGIYSTDCGEPNFLRSETALNTRPLNDQ